MNVASIAGMGAPASVTAPIADAEYTERVITHLYASRSNAWFQVRSLGFITMNGDARE